MTFQLYVDGQRPCIIEPSWVSALLKEFWSKSNSENQLPTGNHTPL